MTDRLFNKVAGAIWKSRRFRPLDDTSKLLQMYLICSPHQNSTGCYEAPDGYVCTDLSWSLEQYQTARIRLLEAELIDFDKETSEIYVERWFQHCAPDNPKHARGTARRIDQIASPRLREKVKAELEAAERARVERKEREAAERQISAITEPARGNNGHHLTKRWQR